MRKLLRSALLLVAMSSVMYGDHNNNMLARHAPEIDPNSAIAAVFLLSSGVLMMIKGHPMKKLELKQTDTFCHNLIDYSLIAGFVAVTAGTVVPGLADSMSPIFSKVGSMMFDAFFFLFRNA